MTARRPVERLRAHIGLLVALAVGVVVLSPWLWGTGFMLHYDLVFVPHLPLSASTAGLDGDVPRAVPNDLVVALLDVALPGWFVERVILLGFFVVIGWGVDRWRAGPAARFAACMALCWNPWVGERLAIGHWGYLWGYAGLVWIVVGALAVRAGAGKRGSVTFGAGLVMASLSGSTGGVLAAVAALVLMAWPGMGRPTWRRVILGGCWWVALNAAWWFPFLTLAPSGTADSRGVSAFAARADSPAGLWASLASGGGIWNSSSWFSSRGSGVVVVLVALAAAMGVWVFARANRPDAGWSVLTLALLGLGVAAAAALPGADDVVTWIVLHMPGGGLLRDSQKFVALWIVPAGLGIGCAVEEVRRRSLGTLLAPLVLVAAVIVPVATLPTLAGADGGHWAQAQYPTEFRAVARQLGARSEGVAVFPWQLYRRYAWNAGQVTLDPWQRLLPNHVILDDDLPLENGVVRGENATSQQVTTALRRGDSGAAMRALRGAGVRYVIEQKDQPPGAGRAPAVGAVIHDGPLLQVRDVGVAPDGGTRHDGATAWWAGVGLGLTGVGVLSPGVVALVRRVPQGRSTDTKVVRV